MKIWIKYLIAIALGIISTFALPLDSVQAQSTLDFIVNLVVRFGRYIILPVLFFSIANSCYKLREEKLMLKTGLWTFGTIIVSSFCLMLLGLISGLIIKLPRIPISIEKVNEIPNFNWENLLTKVFPYSAFQTLLEGEYLLPCFIFAGLLGAACASDKTSSKYAVNLFDSLSKVCYIVLSFFTEILTIGLVAIMTRWTFNLKTVLISGNYNFLILMLTILLLIIAFGICPLIIRFVCHDHHPYKVMYSCLSSFFVAFISGDTNLTLALNLRNGKESLGIRRRTNSVSYPLFAIFGRGGAALVSPICFILILRSYSSLGISVLDALWIGGLSFILSFTLAEIPTGGPFFLITTMCAMYGRGFETGYLLLRDVSPIICTFAAGIDALIAMVGSYIIAVKSKTIYHQDIKKFI